MTSSPSIIPSAALKVKQAVAYEASGKYESAIMTLNEALMLQPGYLDALLIKGVILGKLGMCSEALRCYNAIIESDPQSFDAWRLKAATYTSQGLHDKAAECFQRAVELNPANLEFRLSLAGAFQRQKKFDEALKCYVLAKEQWPGDARVDYYIGIMWSNSGDQQKALTAFEDALQLKPDFTEALLAKGIVLAKLGRKAEAQEIAHKILETKGASDNLTDILASMRQGASDEVLRGLFVKANQLREPYNKS